MTTPTGWRLVPEKPTPEMVAAMAVEQATGTIDGVPTIGMSGAVLAYESALAAAPQPPTQPEQKPVKAWYMRDNHTFRQLPLDVEGALAVMREERDAGNTYGMLCGHPRTMGFVHARGAAKWDAFEAEARPWLERAVELHRKQTAQPEATLWALTAREALELIAAPKRPDGTWNRDREACRQIAAEALGRHDEPAGMVRPEPSGLTEEQAAQVLKALRRAFDLGERHWQQADSESYSQNRKADETRQRFTDLCAEVERLVREKK